MLTVSIMTSYLEKGMPTIERLYLPGYPIPKSKTDILNLEEELKKHNQNLTVLSLTILSWEEIDD